MKWGNRDAYIIHLNIALQVVVSLYFGWVRHSLNLRVCACVCLSVSAYLCLSPFVCVCVCACVCAHLNWGCGV